MTRKQASPRIFDTDRRIRLGIWGLGRGMSFYQTCAALNIDVVAGCDYNEHMRQAFLRANPGAFATADAEAFLARDFDAVLLATYCPAHANDAIRCLRAGKHVLSEVTAFHTLAEGVRLVEAVEQSGKVYNLAENYPFTATNMYLARRWREGLFGDLMYAEYEYVHECRSLCYTYIDGVPVRPGHTVHNWRTWINYHYYCTHSLGPIMVITGTRPTRVTALPAEQTLAGYLMKNREGMGGVTPSLINMSNGAVVRNLMGATTNDSHQQRLWGTLGSAEIGHDGLLLRLGASGGSPKLKVTPRWDVLGELAARTGHGGGDFWVLYYFVRQILTGEPGPFDIYAAADVTIPGILAMRSSTEDGRPYAVPDFRLPEARAQWRDDQWAQKRYDTQRGVFPANADPAVTDRFTTVMRDLIACATTYRAYRDWGKVAQDLADASRYLEIVEALVQTYPRLRATYGEARRIIDAYPQSDGARVLSEMLAVGEEQAALAPAFLRALRRRHAALKRVCTKTSDFLSVAEASALLPAPDNMRKAALPSRTLKYKAIPFVPATKLLDVRERHQGKHGLVYVRARTRMPGAAPGRFLFGADGPVKVWINRRPFACEPRATNPAVADQYGGRVRWKKGINEILFALSSNTGCAWGVIGRCEWNG